MKNTITILTLTTLLSACAITGGPNPAKQAEAQNTIPTCKTDRECELKWAVARKWILENADYKLKTVTSDYLETYSATGGSQSISMRLSKEPVASGGYRFVGGAWCDNMFGCVPDAWDTMIKFHKAVNAVTGY